MPTTLTIARVTFIEAVRQPVYLIMLLLCGVAMFLTTYSTGFSLGYTEAGEVSGDNKLLLDLGLATVFLCGTLLAAFVATSAMSREIENKTVLTVVSKPVSRPVVVIGKYVGVTTAVVVAVATMMCFLLLSLRHGVMTNAGQDLDLPVVIMSTSALALAIIVGLWCNFFYGWSFPQTCSMTLCPLIMFATFAALMVGPDWSFLSRIKQPGDVPVPMFLLNFKPQITMACVAVTGAIVVLCAVAVAASTRLGQVMTLVVCFGVFVLGMLSSPLIGRHAFTNQSIGTISKASAERERFDTFENSGDIWNLVLKSPPSQIVKVGDPVWYGPFPNGFSLEVDAYAPIDRARMNERETLFKPGQAPAIVVTAIDPQQGTLTMMQVGSSAKGVAIGRVPRAGDFVFIAPTRVNQGALVAWGVIPNLQHFWLLDAVNQNQAVPFRHMAMILAYCGCLVAAFLGLAVLLFQTRDVG